MTSLAVLLISVLAAGTNSVTLHKGGQALRITPISDRIIHVESVPDGDFSDRSSLIVTGQSRSGNAPEFKSRRKDKELILSTSYLDIKLDEDLHMKFFRRKGNELLFSEERREFTAVEAEGKSGFSWRLVGDVPGRQSFYGLGQHQTAELDRRGSNEEMFQYNTKISVPFVVSSQGYGILWDSYSLSRWGDPRPYSQLGEVFTLYDKEGRKGCLTGTYSTAKGETLVRDEERLFFEDEESVKQLPRLKLKGADVCYEGFLEAEQTGEYEFTLYYAGYQKLYIDGREVVSERWRAAWNPNSYKFRVRMEKGRRVPIRLEWQPDGDSSYLGLRAHSPYADSSKLSIWTEMTPQMDWYFIAGEDMDEVISGYRKLSGKAQIMPRWAMGFWLSKERYKTQDEIVEAAEEMRSRRIPFDVIVQDWQYWLPDQWGSHEFDAARYPDPEKMLDDIHALDARFMISVWPKFYTNTEHYKQLKQHGWVYPLAEQIGLKDWLGHRQSFYDAYSEGARRMFWNQMDESLYSRFGRKIDAWWMDASEPNLRDCLPTDFFRALTTPTALGPSTEYLNAYALVNAQAIYEGQRSVEPDKRVFLLTRNGFAGLQRYSTASWSGDIGTSWVDMRTQMSAGLGYSLSGIPFWGMDIGGFSVQDKFSRAARGADETALREWKELQTRWYQFGVFVPLFRAHGQWPDRELWKVDAEGGETYTAILKAIKLRYKLLPYIYSLAADVHFNDGTIMRALPMDFPDDMKVRDMSTQWMFGPALMPCPVHEYGARSRQVYMPQGSTWYDFYSGKRIAGGTGFEADAPYDRIPLYVRAGSIIPMYPDEVDPQSSNAPMDKLEVHVWPGADGSFTLYEDDGTSYAYEKGAYSTTEFRLKGSRLEIRAGKNAYGTPADRAEGRIFTIVLPDGSRKDVSWRGRKLVVKF